MCDDNTRDLGGASIVTKVDTYWWTALSQESSARNAVNMDMSLTNVLSTINRFRHVRDGTTLEKVVCVGGKFMKAFKDGGSSWSFIGRSAATAIGDVTQLKFVGLVQSQ